MIFEKGFIYHIYNQGNYRQKIFFSRENYLFFLRKIKTHVAPYADILAWCLMPNHFHLMVLVNELEIPVAVEGLASNIDTMTSSHRINKKQQTFNYSIAIMLRSYTRAINKQENTSGSLFRPHTKAECVNCPNGITPSFITKNGITEITTSIPEKQYPQICFNYIHQNPVKAKLVKQTVDWEFSSAKDYTDMRNGKLINKKLAKHYELA